MAARIVALFFVVALGTAGFWYYKWRESNPAQPPALTAEAKAYTGKLPLSEIELKATEAFTGQAVVEILGKITNAGDRSLDSVAVICIFHDAYSQVVLRERALVVKSSGGALKPGETRPFRLAFDTIPDSWNQTLPQLVIASIQFAS